MSPISFYNNTLKAFSRFLRRRSGAAAAAVLVAAALALAAHAAWRPVEDAGPDGQTYIRLGTRAAAGGLVDCGNFEQSYWSPAWVATIALVFRAAGPRPIAVRMLLVAAALATACLVWSMAMRLAGRCASVIALALFLFSTLVFRYTAYYQYEVPLALLTALCGYLVFFVPRRTRTAVAAAAVAGTVAAIAALHSPRTLALIPLMGAGIGLSYGWRRTLAVSAALLAGLTMVLLPWAARNHRCFGEWIATTTNGGINLYIGNNPYSTGGYYLPPEEERPTYPFHESGRWTSEALRYAAHHPVQTVGRSIVKGIRFWNPHYGDQFLALLLYVAGWVRLLRSRRLWTPALLWVAGVPILLTLVHAVFFVQVRYMIPALPMVAVFAGAGACGWRVGHDAPRLPAAAGVQPVERRPGPLI